MQALYQLSYDPVKEGGRKSKRRCESRCFFVLFGRSRRILTLGRIKEERGQKEDACGVFGGNADTFNLSTSQIINRATDESTDVITDTKLQQFFERAREASRKVSKVVGENGEPLVVSILVSRTEEAELDLNSRAEADSDASAEELAEARRQYAAVVARYTNPDGTKKPGWMKAPNGKPTNLNERQWVRVRTPFFRKNYFGDWLYLLHKEFLEGEAIATASVSDAPQGGFALLREWATNLFNKQGGKAVSPEIGDVLLDERAVRDTLAHGGANPYKRAAFNVVKKVIEHGRL
ncbi:MAG: hypothetical protein LBS59_06770, partial [Puniceicoccales bacterium]|nr:hypothetical protein [Puniceicoccales bacterium]